MAAGSLLTLLDDIASILDDVSILTKKAAAKTAGVLGDDLALNAQKVSGVVSQRELPVVWAVAKGSFLNKLILVPLALLIGTFAPWAIVPLLMVGGLFLCFEGVEKLHHAMQHRARKSPEAAGEKIAVLAASSPQEVVETEAEKIKGAVRTDFILSAEIIAITLGTVADENFTRQVLVLSAIAVVMTVGVYGLVAGIVKLDDAGLYLTQRRNTLAQKTGRGGIEENDAGGIADRGVVAGEREAAGLRVHSEGGDVVAALVAAVEELAARVKIETARVISAGPFLAEIGQGPVFADGENGDAVMQAVAGIKETPVCGDHDFRAEITAGETRRQAGDGLPRGQPSQGGIVVKQDEIGPLLLDRIKPTAVRMEMEMPRPVSGRQGDGGRIVRGQHPFPVIELPEEDLIQSEIHMDHEATRRVGLDHVGMGAVVAADGKTSRRRVGGFFRSEGAGIDFDIRGRTQTAVGQYRQHRHGAAEVVGDE